MPSPYPAYRIQLTSEQEETLRQLVAKHTAPQAEVRRARMLLLAHEHPQWNNQEIASQVGCHFKTVQKWRRRWYQQQSVQEVRRPGRPRSFPP